MNIESLKYFYMIAKAGNISSVAKEIHLSQSALSQQIQKLEADFSKDLLERSNKGVTLTPAGKIVFMYAENIIRTHDKMIAEIASEDDKNINIKLEACHSLADYALPCTMIKANGKYKNHRYELSSNTSEQILINVSNNICDVGFSYIKDTKGYKDVLSKKAGTNNIILVTKNDDKLPDAITPKQLINSCLITFTGKNDITEVIFENLSKFGIDRDEMNCQLKVEGIEGAKTLVSRGYGMTFLPYISVKEELYKKEFKEIKIPEFDMNMDIILLYKKDRTNHVQDFLAWFESEGITSFC